MKQVILLAIFLSGCNYIPCSSSSDLTIVKEIPMNVEIAGIYKPDSFTRQDFKQFSNSDSVLLTLTADGRISLKNFPKMIFGLADDSIGGVINASGTWLSELVKTVKIKTDLKFNQLEQAQPNPLDLFKREDKYYILIPFGDPDGCTTVRLVKQ